MSMNSQIQIPVFKYCHMAIGRQDVCNKYCHAMLFRVLLCFKVIVLSCVGLCCCKLQRSLFFLYTQRHFPIEVPVVEIQPMRQFIPHTQLTISLYLCFWICAQCQVLHTYIFDHCIQAERALCVMPNHGMQKPHGMYKTNRCICFRIWFVVTVKCIYTSLHHCYDQ